MILRGSSLHNQWDGQKLGCSDPEERDLQIYGSFFSFSFFLVSLGEEIKIISLSTCYYDYRIYFTVS